MLCIVGRLRLDSLPEGILDRFRFFRIRYLIFIQPACQFKPDLAAGYGRAQHIGRVLRRLTPALHGFTGEVRRRCQKRSEGCRFGNGITHSDASIFLFSLIHRKNQNQHGAR
jgi:hypothetical protein